MRIPMNLLSIAGAAGVWASSGLLVLLSVLGTAGAASAQAGSGIADAGRTQAAYRVINLGPGTIAAYPHINAAGQVAFSLTNDNRIDGFFYDGNVVRKIGSPGGHTVYVNGLNDAGQIAGTSVNEDGVGSAFFWSAGSGLVDIRAEPGRGRSYGWAINHHGVVTGSFGAAGHPFRWSMAGGLEDLGVTPAIPAPAAGRVLNDAGLIAGVTTIDDEVTRVFAWTRSGGVVDIDTLGSVESSPVAVGAGGEVAGNRLASQDDAGDRPFLWTRATGMVDLGTGPGTSAWVNAMTPGLHIAGAIGHPDGRQRAMSWTRQGGMRELGTLGGRTSVAQDVNAKGQVVGFAEDGAGAMRAFVWRADNGMRDLNRSLRHAPPGLVLEHALAINDSGAIVAASNAGLVLLQPDPGCRCGHTLGPLEAPRSVEVGATLQASVAWVDGDRIGTRSVEWSWGDGSGGSARVLVGAGGTGQATTQHGFSAPGRYQVTATVVGRDGRRTVVAREVAVMPARSELPH
jgi:probable HAF family extracellular repeat protein